MDFATEFFVGEVVAEEERPQQLSDLLSSPVHGIARGSAAELVECALGRQAPAGIEATRATVSIGSKKYDYPQMPITPPVAATMFA